MRIMLTGASGFLGARLARTLIARGVDEVLSLGRRASDVAGVRNLVTPDFSREALTRTLGDVRFDALFHLAAAGVHPADRDAATLFETNTCVPARLVAFTQRAGARAIVIAGSSAEYRQPASATPVLESDAMETERAYGASKAAGSMLALAQGAASGIPVAVLRMFNLYGPGEASHRLFRALHDGLGTGRRVPLSAGTQIRDFVQVDDACDGLLLALGTLLDGTMPSGAYNLASGIGCSVADFARMTARAMRADESLIDFGALPMRADDLPYLVGDATRLHRSTGWVPRRTLTLGLAQSLAEMPQPNLLNGRG